VRVDSLVHMFPLLMNDVPMGTSLNVIFFDIVISTPLVILC
jgi:hypothetical protein